MTGETALIASNRQARRDRAHPPAAIVARFEGTILPPGASWIEAEQAYNFMLYAEHAESVVLLLFGEDDLARPLLEFRLAPRVNKTWRVWHCRLGGDLARAVLRLPDRRAPPPPARAVACLRSGEGPPRPLGEGGLHPAGVRSRGRQAPGLEPGEGAAGCPAAAGAEPRPGSRPDAATSAGHRDHLRDARPRIHRDPNSGVPPGAGAPSPA